MSVPAWIVRRRLARWALMFALGFVGQLALGAYLMARHAAGVTGHNLIGGPLTIVQLLVVHSPLTALAVAGGISLNLGLLNALPLIPLDGGRIASRWLLERYGETVEEAFGWGSLGTCALMFAATTAIDFGRLR